jgi:threonine dehydratase
MENYPNFQDVCDAAEQLKGSSIRTAVLTNQRINQLIGAEIFFKCENLQHIGAFKFRGAYNAISRLSEQQRSAGVIAYSSGNHAQAIARVCQMQNIPATIVMPDNAPKIKRQATAAYGAKIIEYNPDNETREAIADKVNHNNKLSLIPPFNHPHIIAGQGTAALELVQDITSIEQVLVPCGGGGLLSGSALAIKGLAPKCSIIGVEPERADDATQSFEQGKIISIDYPDTIADGTRTLSLGDLTFPIIMDKVDGMVTVSEEMIREAVRVLFYHLKQVVEPSGALGLAVLLSGKIKTSGRIGIVLSGGNIDGETMSMILNEKTIS